MMLIVDSGSTKCDWVVPSKEQDFRLTSLGINPVQQTDEQIREIVQYINFPMPITHIYFYGAGCNPLFEEALFRLRHILEKHFHTSAIEIQSDLVGALRSLFLRKEGIACILGTGSNSAYGAEGQILKNTPPLGYILGDEGSGAVMGRNLINGVLKGRIPLREELFEHLEMTYAQLIHRIYREANPNRFMAQLAPFIHEHLSVEGVEEMVKGGFREFAQRNLSSYPQGIEVGAIGSIAYHFAPLLQKAFEEEGYIIRKIEKSPMEGLKKYHHLYE